MNQKINEYFKYALLISYGLILVLVSQFVISQDTPEVTITLSTIYGAICLLLISLIGIAVSQLVRTRFPILGWVSISSLIICLPLWPWSDFFINSIASINFLSLTTPVLAFAGISVADKLLDLGKNSWKIIIVAVFVFIGTYLFSATIAQVLLSI